MKVTIEIIADALDEFSPQKQIHENDFLIDSVRLFSRDVELEASTLYIARMGDVFKNSSMQVICTHGSNILKLNTTDIYAVINKVLDTIARFAKWECEVLEILNKDGGLQDIMDASQEFLRKPVFLLDHSQRYLAHHRQFGVGEVDPMWDMILENGACPMEFLVNLNRLDPARNRHRGVYCYEKGFLPHSSYHYNFRVNRFICGTATIIQKGGELTQGELDIFTMFCEYENRWFEMHFKEQNSLMLESELHSVIKSKESDQSELVRLLKLLGWEEKDQLMFLKLDTCNDSFSVVEYMVRTMMQAEAGTVAIKADLSVCLLCNCTQQPDDFEDNLKNHLVMNKYCATASGFFSLEDNFYDNYSLVDVCSHYVPKEIGVIYDSYEYCFPYLLSLMRTGAVKEARHPDLARLKKYDLTHGTNFMETLQCYLFHERSVVDTAKAMSLHKNTLLYRVGRIKEIIRSDLEDPMNRLYLMISF